METVQKPYPDSSGANEIYQLLFADKPELFNNGQSDQYPWNAIFDDKVPFQDLERIIADTSLESRMKILAYHRLAESGHASSQKDLLGVVVEVGLDDGLDVLASYKDGRARYINYTGRMIIWDVIEDTTSNRITAELFAHSQKIVDMIGPWDGPRRPAPARGTVRITFLVSNQLYFGEGPIDVLFGDPMAAPALSSATELMQYLMQQSQK